MIKNQDKTPNRETHRERDGKEEKVKDHGPSFFVDLMSRWSLNSRRFRLKRNENYLRKKSRKAFSFIASNKKQ
jgi:hypothetical protein